MTVTGEEGRCLNSGLLLKLKLLRSIKVCRMTTYYHRLGQFLNWLDQRL